MLISREVALQIEAFNKYAKFIGEKFGVVVVMDGMEACTDGKVISLPNIASLSPKEIDFLYGVLLHEVGHIRYSTFTKEAFALLISKEHAHMANAIEDARIEKLLLKDFDGAKDIFYKLYNEYTVDADLMNKVFQCSLTNCSEWHGIGIYIHDKILSLPNSVSLEKMIGKKVATKVKKFVSENNVDALISKNPLASWEDVVDLANKVYKLYFKTKKDTSEKIEIKAQEEVIKDVQENILKNLQKKAEEVAKKISVLNQEIKTNKEKINAEWDKNQPKINALNKEIQDLEQSRALLEETNSILEEKSKKETKETSQSQKVEELNSKLNELTKKIEEFKATQPAETEVEELEKFNNKLSKLEERLKNWTEKRDELKSKLEKTQESLKTLGEDSNKLPQILKDLSSKKRDTEIEKLNDKINDLRQKVSKLRSPHELEEVNRKLQKSAEELKEKLASESLNSLQKMQAELNEAGIPVNILPEFEKNEGWEEADVVQQEFDAQASQESNSMVVNGCSLNSSSSRDILTLVEKAGSDLENVNLADHFKAENKMSKFDSFNEVLSEMTYYSENDTKVYSAKRQHIPLTTQFDVVKTENKAKDLKSFTTLKVKMHADLFKIRRLFKTKLKFSKKDFFKGNQEEGGLDSRSLWKLPTKLDDNYFEVNRPKQVNKVAASIALDISGSMDKDEEIGKKIKEITLMLSEGLSECFIKHEICGFHAPVSQEMRSISKAGSFNRKSNNLETIVYKTFKDKVNSGINNLEIKCSDNSDGESLKIIAKRLMKENSKKKVLFVVTDGKPFLSDADIAVMDQDLKNTLNWLSKNKIEVFAFGFNDQPSKFYGERYCKVSTLSDIITFCSKKLG